MRIIEQINDDRLIGAIEHDTGAILLLIGGIHGNEPAGIEAIENVFESLTPRSNKVRGSVYGIKGNLKALQQNQRFIDKDFNRIWSDDFEDSSIQQLAEYEEYLAIKKIIDTIKQEQGNRHLVVLDLHTTSSKSLPFILSNQDSRNRSLLKPIPVPTIFGVENRIKGTLMSYINQLGDSGIVFEAGEHLDPMSVHYHQSIIKMLMVGCGIFNQVDVEDYETLVQDLFQYARSMQYIFEITFRYGIKNHEQFKMRPGFENFMKIDQGTILANNEHGDILAPLPGRIFMPLYQEQGEDGFFIIDEMGF